MGPPRSPLQQPGLSGVLGTQTELPWPRGLPPPQLTRNSQLSLPGTRLAPDRRDPALEQPRPVSPVFPTAPAGPCQRATWPFPGEGGARLPQPPLLVPALPRASPRWPLLPGPISLADFPITRQDLNSWFPRVSQLRKAAVEEMFVWGPFPSHNSQCRCGSHSHPLPPVQTFPRVSLNPAQPVSLELYRL